MPPGASRSFEPPQSGYRYGSCPALFAPLDLVGKELWRVPSPRLTCSNLARQTLSTIRSHEMQSQACHSLQNHNFTRSTQQVTLRSAYLQRTQPAGQPAKADANPLLRHAVHLAVITLSRAEFCLGRPHTRLTCIAESGPLEHRLHDRSRGFQVQGLAAVNGADAQKAASRFSCLRGRSGNRG